MDSLTFISQLTDSVAWPISVIIIVIILKKPIIKLFSNIKRFKYKDAEFDFEKAIYEVSTDSETSTPISNSQLKLIELSPRGAIIESWLELEEVIVREREKTGASKTRPGGLEGKPVAVDPLTMAQHLMMFGKLSSSSYERFQKLRKIRNNAVHLTDDVIGTDEADAFVRLVAELKLEIKNA